MNLFKSAAFLHHQNIPIKKDKVWVDFVMKPQGKISIERKILPSVALRESRHNPWLIRAENEIAKQRFNFLPSIFKG